jgi:hypothetical protein
VERVIRAVIRVPWLARRALARRSAARGRNVLAGYLMHPVTALGGLIYRHLVWAKEPPRELGQAAGASPGAAAPPAATAVTGVAP